MGGMPPGMDPSEIGAYVAALDQPAGEPYKAKLVKSFALIDSGRTVREIEGDPQQVQHIKYTDPDDLDHPGRLYEASFVKLDGQWCFGAPVPWRDAEYGALLVQ